MANAGPITTEEVLAQMREAGGRVTTQRRLVLDALVATQPHPSVDDVVAWVERTDPDVHVSTVYRTLNTLTELGVVSHVHLGHGRSVYHFTHDAQPHLVCRGCSAVTHLDGATFAHVRDVVTAATGFELEPGHFAWTASCSACAARRRGSDDEAAVGAGHPTPEQRSPRVGDRD